MLFSSPEFVFAFLPIVVVVWFVVARFASYQLALAWLVASSLFFYGWWEPWFLVLLLGSVTVNYTLGQWLSNQPSRVVLGFGIIFNLALIGAFKYADFLIASVNTVASSNVGPAGLILPLAISFFTFQQIAYLVDVHRGEVRDASFLNYTLFVTFFPQLIAGPIVHHSETIPQFADRRSARLDWDNLSIGLTIFIIGLYKKIVFADGMGIYANLVFDGVSAGQQPDLLVAWGGVMAYSLQIYFDFSGYSDMAIGIARMFGIRLPLNFDSPYKAINIVEFWRRWHMTLSRFLRDYLYFPLGGNRKGLARRHVNLMATMALGGLWHGAAWNFVFWGALHGLYLIVNHIWHRIRRSLGHDLERSSATGRAVARAMTFLAVAIGWVFFRAEDWGAALGMLSGMAGLNGVAPGAAQPFDGEAAAWIAALLMIVWFAPNTQQLMARRGPALDFPASGPVVFACGGWGAMLDRHQSLWLAPFVGISIVCGSLILLARDVAPIFIYMVF